MRYYLFELTASIFLHEVRHELCPEKRMLFYPKLPKIIGSDSLEDRIRSIHGAEGKRDASSCHVFGHTHFCWDAVVDGIRYHLLSSALLGLVHFGTCLRAVLRSSDNGKSLK